MTTKKKETPINGFITDTFILLVNLAAKYTSILLFFYTYSDYTKKKNHEIIYSVNRVDIVLCCCIAFEVIGFCLHSKLHSSVFNWIVIFFALLRIVNIISYALMNILIHSSAKDVNENALISYKRSFVLAIINYLELIILFATLYSLFPNHLLDSGKNIVSDKLSILYFSNITQLTVGYGDISPTGKIRIVACFQGLIGVFLIATTIAKLVAVIPISEKK